MKKQFDGMLSFIKEIRELVATAVLWIFIWAGYNANFWRIKAADFPSSLWDFIQGIRAIFPIGVAVCLLIYFFLKKEKLAKNFFLTPLGLISIYTIIGIIAAVLSKDTLNSLYWAFMYGSVIVFLYFISQKSDALKHISLVIQTNWMIALFLTLFLTSFFFSHQGTIQSLTYNIFICNDRPYERLGIGPEINTFGMAGTRPTGLARYAGVFVLVAFWRFLNINKNKNAHWLMKILWLVLFIISFLILIFSKGKTELVAFIAALLFILWFYRKFRTFWIILAIAVIVSSSMVILYHIPCSNDVGLLFPFLGPSSKPVAESPEVSVVVPGASILNQDPNAAPQNIPDQSGESEFTPTQSKAPSKVIDKRSVGYLLALSGRANITWPAALKLFWTSPVVGYGFHADRFFLEGQHAHNTLIHTLVQAGLLGTISFFYAVVLIISYLYRIVKQSTGKIFLIEISAVFIFVLVRGIMESFAFYSADWLFLAPLIVYIQALYAKNLP